jgi:3D (Asp-Asp-Asp) domain-containing protein
VRLFAFFVGTIGRTVGATFGPSINSNDDPLDEVEAEVDATGMSSRLGSMANWGATI